MQSALPIVFVCCVELLQITSPLRNPRGGTQNGLTVEVAATGNESSGTVPSAGRVAASNSWTNCAATLEAVKPKRTPGEVYTTSEFATAREFAFCKKRA